MAVRAELAQARVSGLRLLLSAKFFQATMQAVFGSFEFRQDLCSKDLR
jgi:hypothetical protein